MTLHQDAILVRSQFQVVTHADLGQNNPQLGSQLFSDLRDRRQQRSSRLGICQGYQVDSQLHFQQIVAEQFVDGNFRWPRAGLGSRRWAGVVCSRFHQFLVQKIADTKTLAAIKSNGTFGICVKTIATRKTAAITSTSGFPKT